MIKCSKKYQNLSFYCTVIHGTKIADACLDGGNRTKVVKILRVQWVINKSFSDIFVQDNHLF